MDKKQHKELLAYLLTQTRECFPEKDDGHGEDHLLRVLKSAMLLGEQLGGDKTVIVVAAILHDIHRWLNISPIQSLDRVSDIIFPLSLSTKQNQQILCAIRDHELYAHNGRLIFPLETQIIQDADRLDALGAIGIVRTFQYGFAHRIPYYTTRTELRQSESYTFETKDASTIHHLYNKLIRLDEFMNTHVAKEVARARIGVMKIFLEAFLREWNEADYEL